MLFACEHVGSNAFRHRVVSLLLVHEHKTPKCTKCLWMFRAENASANLESPGKQRLGFCIFVFDCISKSQIPHGKKCSRVLGTQYTLAEFYRAMKQCFCLGILAFVIVYQC